MMINVIFPVYIIYWVVELSDDQRSIPVSLYTVGG